MFEHYLPQHREWLKWLLGQREWQETLESINLDKICCETLSPPSPPSQLTGATQYLLQQNGERMKELLREGVTDEEKLTEALFDWESALAGYENFPILFLGLVLTLNCSFEPIRCIYCNQRWLPQSMRFDDWKAVIEEVAKSKTNYIYLNG